MRIYRVLAFKQYPHHPRADTIIGHVVVPDAMNGQKVMQAWSYALRHTAKGLDLPDVEAAIKFMLERHPTWQFEKHPVEDVWYSPDHADKYKPD